MRPVIHFMHLEIRPAGAKGRGVFASAPIPRGTLVAEMAGEVLPTSKLTDDMLCLQVNDGLWLCTYGDQLDDCINHSCAPNTGFLRGTPTLYALRDIAADEEITFDYSTSMSERGWSLECHCGAPECRQTVRPWPELSDSERTRLFPVALDYLRHPPYHR